MSKLALLSPKPVVTFAIVLLVAAILPTIVFATARLQAPRKLWSLRLLAESLASW
jgi:hypothetical protein